MNTLWQDIRYALRVLARSPGFAVVAVLTLALGIGANTMIFTWMSGILLNPLPGVAEPDRMVALYLETRGEANTSLSYLDFVDLRDRTSSFSGVIAFNEQAMSLRAGDRAVRLWGMVVSGNYFDVLAVRPTLGRGFRPDEDRVPGEKPVVVISDAMWKQYFAADAALIGKTITLDNQPFTVVGVAPPGFRGTITGLAFDLWVPMMMQKTIVPGGDRLSERGRRWLDGLARLKPGVRLDQARAELGVFAKQLAREYPNTNQDVGAKAYPLLDNPVGAIPVLKPILGLLLAVAGVVLLIVCANIANLLLSRAANRRREIAVRLSVGASRARLVRQLLTESVLMALGAGLLGYGVAQASAGALQALVPPTDFPVGLQFGVDQRVLLFASVVSLLTGVLFGLVPALQASRADLVSALKGEAQAPSRGFWRGRHRSALVVAQVSLSLMLLITAGLFLRSIRKAQSFDLGFDPENVLLASVDLFPNGYEAPAGQRFYEQLLDELRRLPGVESASVARRVPLGFGGSSSSTISVEGYQPAKDEMVWSFYNNVGPRYFETMRIPLVSGREFTIADKAASARVTVINRALAARYWPGRDALGQRVKFGQDWYTIVGIARDSKYHRLQEPPQPYLFLPVLQAYSANAVVIVRASKDLSSLETAAQEVVARMDPNMPLFGVRTLQAHIGAASFQQQLGGKLLGIFGGLALVLAAVGIYSVMAFNVTSRTREIGIRMALGADIRDVLRLALSHGLKLTLVGIALGLAGAFSATRLLSSLLFGVGPADVLTYLGMALLLGLVAMVACYLPARRATRVDPMVALRYE